MLNSLTLRNLALRKLEKQENINLKQSLDRLGFPYFLASSVTAKINTLSCIVEIDKIFFYEAFKEKRYIPYRKAKKPWIRKK